MLSGLRPSSGAETLQKDAATEMSDPFERTGVAAAEDGRTPHGHLRSAPVLGRSKPREP